MPHSLDDWLQALETRGWKGRRSGQEWKGPCPRCGGHDRFHVAPGSKVSVVAHCRHDCSFSQLSEAVLGAGRPQRNEVAASGDGRTGERDLDRSALNAAGLAKALVDRLTLQWQAAGYLEKRGLDAARLEKYGWRSVIPIDAWRSLADLPAQYGWPRWTDGSARWPLQIDRGRALVIPLRDRARRLVGVRFRSERKWREERERKQLSAPKAIGLAGVPPLLYGADALGRPQGSIVHIAEGEIDAESLRQHGAAAIGVPGASIWRKEWTEWIHELKPRRVVIWFDGDEAGEKGGRRLQETLADYQVYRLINVNERDVNDLCVNGELEDLVRRAEEA